MYKKYQPFSTNLDSDLLSMCKRLAFAQKTSVRFVLESALKMYFSNTLSCRCRTTPTEPCSFSSSCIGQNSQGFCMACFYAACEEILKENE